jgi:YidC/Oxa1 family membrane protein insertase
MIYLYKIIFYQPILNTLVFFYNTVAFRDFGLAIIFTTLLVRIILYPLFHKGSHQQMVMQRLQPKIKKIQETHKDDKEKQSRALMDLYKEHGVNPFSGILLLIVQIPILIALYQIVRSSLGATVLNQLYSFVATPGQVNSTFLGFINLSDKNIVLVVLAAIAQYFQAKLAIYKVKGVEPSQAQKIASQMVFIGPIITVFIFYNFPAAVGLYWLSSSVFSVFQQLIVNKKLKKKYGE